jgi:hypothetical protein
MIVWAAHIFDDWIPTSFIVYQIPISGCIDDVQLEFHAPLDDDYILSVPPQ